MTSAFRLVPQLLHPGRNNKGKEYLESLHHFAYEMSMRGRKNHKCWAYETIAKVRLLEQHQPDVFSFIKGNLPTVDENFGEVR